MENVNFQEIFNTLKDGVITLATNSVKSYVSQAKKDGLRILEEMKGELQMWAQQMKDGEMTEAELKDLVKGQITTLKLDALKQTGIAAIELDKFKKGLTDLITSTISTVI